MASEKLIESYLKDEISLQDFQFQIEILMGNFISMSKDDTEKVKKLVNQIEIIIFTFPNSSQKDEIKKIIPKIHDYFKHKISSFPIQKT